VFYPLAIDTMGTWHYQAIDLVEEIGKCTTSITRDPKEMAYVFQQLSMTLQTGNGFSLPSTSSAS